MNLLDVPTYRDLQEAKQRIPDKYRGLYTFFSDSDLWRYEVDWDKTAKGNGPCQQCLTHEDSTYIGSKLRLLFPYLEIMTQEYIHPHVHPNCRCRLWWSQGVISRYTI
jgi:hypothetical protein